MAFGFYYERTGTLIKDSEHAYSAFRVLFHIPILNKIRAPSAHMPQSG